ncbi:hypothetical protein J6590_073642 [Homalodisca vitripennis]|nr:hypothetical protein J6590_073642 [Homalodisca vitripennis]
MLMGLVFRVVKVKLDINIKSVLGLIFLILGVVSCFQQGVIFEGGRDVLLTDSHWRVTLQYNLTQIEEESRNLSILWEVGTQKLLISKDRLMYSMYNQLEFDRECRGEQLIVCPLSNVLLSVSKRPNCAVEMFHYEQVRLCGRKLISGLRSPVLVKTPNRWIYSASEEHRLTLNCLTSDGTLNITSAVVKGVGEFRGIDMYDVVSEEFKVPARIHGSSVFSEQISEIVFPNVEEIYTSEEKELFSSEQETAVKVLQGLNERLGTLGVKEYRPEDVVRHLKSHILFGRRFYAAKVAAAGSFGLVSILMLVYMCYRFVMPVMAWWSSRRNRRRQRRSATLTRGLRKSERPDVTRQS